MKNSIIAIVLALACYTLAVFLNGKFQSETFSIVPLHAAIFTGIGAYAASLISRGAGH